MLTELGGPQVEVQQCPLRAEVGEEIGEELAGPKPAVEVQQCPLRAEVGEEIGDKSARRKWTLKLMQTWSRRKWRRRKRRRRMRRTALIKSNNLHLAGGEQLHKVDDCIIGVTELGD